MRVFSFLSVACALALLSACAVGPDFTPPAPPEAGSYDSESLSAVTADGAQEVKEGKQIESKWWAAFHSASLNALVDRALQRNPDLETMQARLRGAEAARAAEEAALFPTVSGGFSSQRQKTSGASNGGLFRGFTYTLHDASVGVSWGLDLFGGTRRAVEGLDAQVNQTRFEEQTARLALIANVVTTAVQEAALQERLKETESLIADQTQILKIVTARFDAGSVPKGAVTSQQSAVAAAVATLPPLKKQESATRHALAALTGDMPNARMGATLRLDDLTLPSTLPLTLPSQLVGQRPDIRAAQEDLHAASAAIGVAVAQRLPQITLSADVGSMANRLANLFGPGGGFWNLGANASEVLFDSGALANKEEEARAAYDASAAQYKKTVLAAFQNVADSLHALHADAESLNAAQEAEQAAAETLTLTEVQQKAGAISEDSVLAARAAHSQVAQDLTQAKAQRLADTAALFAALGGGLNADDGKDSQ